MNEWVVESLKRKGIVVNSDGSFDVCFVSRKIQNVESLDAAIRQQEHIIEQQNLEQQENAKIGLLVSDFRAIVMNLSKMSIAELTINTKSVYLSELTEIMHNMSKKREDLRKDCFKRLSNVYKMLERNNLPSANLASQAALDRARKRWLVNEKVINKSMIRLETLKQLKDVTYEI